MLTLVRCYDKPVREKGTHLSIQAEYACPRSEYIPGEGAGKMKLRTAVTIWTLALITLVACLTIDSVRERDGPLDSCSAQVLIALVSAVYALGRLLLRYYFPERESRREKGTHDRSP
jgi:hypothetical protein